MSSTWLYPFILAAGVLQAFGAPMNGQLYKSLANPWLASLVSFGLIVAVLIVLFAVLPRPLPTADSVQSMPWWAPLGGLVGAVAVFAGLMFVSKLGAGPVNGLVIAANLVASLAVDHFGWFGTQPHAINLWRAAGGLLMVGGITLIAAF
jgi:transporter family-2 protein